MSKRRTIKVIIRTGVLLFAFAFVFRCLGFVASISSPAHSPQQVVLEADNKKSWVEFRVPYYNKFNLLGRFNDFKIEMTYSADNFSDARISGSVKVKSIAMPDPKMEKELQQEEMFHSSQFPEILFESVKLEPRPNGKYLVHGNLFLKGSKKPVVLSAQYSGLLYGAKENYHEFTLKGNINRFDFGISDTTALHGNLGHVIGDLIEIECYLMFKKP